MTLPSIFWDVVWLIGTVAWFGFLFAWMALSLCGLICALTKRRFCLLVRQQAWVNRWTVDPIADHLARLRLVRLRARGVVASNPVLLRAAKPIRSLDILLLANDAWRAAVFYVDIDPTMNDTVEELWFRVSRHPPREPFFLRSDPGAEITWIDPKTGTTYLDAIRIHVARSDYPGRAPQAEADAYSARLEKQRREYMA